MNFMKKTGGWIFSVLMLVAGVLYVSAMGGNIDRIVEGKDGCKYHVQYSMDEGGVDFVDKCVSLKTGEDCKTEIAVKVKKLECIDTVQKTDNTEKVETDFKNTNGDTGATGSTNSVMTGDAMNIDGKDNSTANPTQEKPDSDIIINNDPKKL